MSSGAEVRDTEGKWVFIAPVANVYPERIEAFLGWVGYWAERKYEERIRAAYQARCKLVHEGDASGVTEEMLLFTDDLKEKTSKVL